MFDILFHDYIIQGVGILAFFASSITFLMKHDKKFILMMVLVSVLWWIHFGLLGLYAASFINFVDIFKNLLALKYKKNTYITAGVIILYALIGFFTLQFGYMELLPVIASLASIYVVFHLEGIQMRIGFLVIICLWFYYNLIGGSIGGVLSDITIFIIGIVGIYRIYREKKNLSLSS